MKYLLLKHYRGGPTPYENIVPMDQRTPAEIDAHMAYMHDFAARLEGTFVRYDGEGRPPVAHGPFAETKDLIAGWDGDRRRLLPAGHRAGR